MNHDQCERKALRRCAEQAKIWVLVATILASAIAFIDESVVNIALPAIENDIGASVAVIRWIVNTYTLALPPPAKPLHR